MLLMQLLHRLFMSVLFFDWFYVSWIVVNIFYLVGVSRYQILTRATSIQVQLMECLAKKKLWFYYFSIRSWCQAQWFPFQTKGNNSNVIMPCYEWTEIHLYGKNLISNSVLHQMSLPLNTYFHIIITIQANNNLRHRSPVGTRPLSCGQGRCWCWFPEIHHGRFHQPERNMEMWRTNSIESAERVQADSIMENNNVNIDILQSKSVGGKIQCFSSRLIHKVSVGNIFIWELQSNNRGPWCL